MKPLATIGTLLVLPYIAACGFLYLRQASLLYFPTPAVDATGAGRIEFNAGDAKLRIWVVNAETAPAGGPALIYFGGNAEQVADNIARFRRHLPGHTVYLVNYRGYGGSTGQPSEAANFADALNVFDQVKARHSKVAVAGRSLGSGVATYVAAMRDPGEIILITPYDSIEAVARGLYPAIPVSLLLKDKYDSASRAAKVHAPILALVAGQDETIPRERTDALLAALPKQLMTVEQWPHAHHNDISESDEYWEKLDRFLSS